MTAPRRRTVSDVAAPYANFLVPVPRRGPGVCDICRRGVDGTYTRCFKCQRETPGLGRGGADVVVPIALAPDNEQLAYELVNYKRLATSADLRNRFTVGLSSVLWYWLTRHERCVADAISVGSFTVVTTVPSASGRVGVHPLVKLVSGVVAGSQERYRDLLRVTEAELDQREYSADRYVVNERMAGESVLLIDDTWTSGAHAHAAAAALKTAGAGKVGLVTIGRWYHSNDPRNARVEEQRRGRKWSWDECALDG